MQDSSGEGGGGESGLLELCSILDQSATVKLQNEDERGVQPMKDGSGTTVCYPSVRLSGLTHTFLHRLMLVVEAT